MSERIRGFWSTFSEIYGPAIVGGVFLCVADLVQSEANGQLGKLGRVIGKPLQASVQAELVGFLAILALGCLLCWVFRPATRSDSFSKGASEALRIDRDFGTLARGKVADLLVVEKNPLENIANMRTIQTVYLGGRKFE